MAMTQEAMAELDKLIKKTRQKPLPYGLCLGKKPEDNVMCLDLLKTGEVLMRRAKADGDTAKVTFGEAFLEGKVLTLSVHGKMLPGLAKNMKKFMQSTGKKLKVVILGPNGEILEQVEEDDEGNDDVISTSVEENPEPEVATPEEQVDPLAADWKAVQAKLTNPVQVFSNGDDPRAAEVAKAWQGALAAAESGNFKVAMAVATKLAPIVTAAPTASETQEDDPYQAQWEKAFGPLSALYEKAMKNNPENASQLRAAWAMAGEKADAGDYQTAMTVIARLKPRLDEAAAATASGQEAEVPKDVVAFQKSRILWAGTRNKMISEMAKLEAAIAQQCAGDEALQEVVNEVGSLTKRLEVFDANLEDILDQITNTPEGDARTKLKKEAEAAIQQYQNHLDDPFFADVDNNNGFANVSVAASAIKSLDSIAKVLAA